MKILSCSGSGVDAGVANCESPGPYSGESQGSKRLVLYHLKRFARSRSQTALRWAKFRHVTGHTDPPGEIFSVTRCFRHCLTPKNHPKINKIGEISVRHTAKAVCWRGEIQTFRSRSQVGGEPIQMVQYARIACCVSSPFA